eukprot:m.269795 g.269795  ORF g.269795 m.269795 type:complete len:304 (-) comp86337_c0_seq1:34-945(-)
MSAHGIPSYSQAPMEEEPDWAGVKTGKKRISANKLSRMQVWYERAQIVLQLVALGYNVVQSDGDALWLQNPLFELDSIQPEIDVVFSRGNARAGVKGRGTGVCMGFVLYRATIGSQLFLSAVLKRMKEVSDVDQGIANTFIGGSRGSNRDKDMYNPELWYGQFQDTKWVQLPQTRYARHAGKGLVTVKDQVDLHIFHPADEGWTLPFSFLPQVLPDELSKRPENRSLQVKGICNSGRWYERMGFSERDQNVLACCGYWMMKAGWDKDPLRTNEPFLQWLERNSHLTTSKQLMQRLAKKAYMQA